MGPKSTLPEAEIWASILTCRPPGPSAGLRSYMTHLMIWPPLCTTRLPLARSVVMLPGGLSGRHAPGHQRRRERHRLHQLLSGQVSRPGTPGIHHPRPESLFKPPSGSRQDPGRKMARAGVWYENPAPPGPDLYTPPPPGPFCFQDLVWSPRGAPKNPPGGGSLYLYSP